MPRPEIVPLNLPVPLAVGVGSPSYVFNLRDKTVQVTGTFTATLKLEGSVDGNNYQQIGVDITAPTIVSVLLAVQFLRIRVSAFTSGTPSVVASGFDYRAW